MNKEFKYLVPINPKWSVDDRYYRMNWLLQNIENFDWNSDKRIYFRYEEDAIMFKLRFGS